MREALPPAPVCAGPVVTPVLSRVRAGGGSAGRAPGLYFEAGLSPSLSGVCQALERGLERSAVTGPSGPSPLGDGGNRCLMLKGSGSRNRRDPDS